MMTHVVVWFKPVEHDYLPYSCITYSNYQQAKRAVDEFNAQHDPDEAIARLVDVKEPDQK